MSRWLLIFALLGWSLLQAGVSAVGDTAAMTADHESAAISSPGDTADDSPDALEPPAAATIPETTPARAPAPLERAVIATSLSADHQARAPPLTEST